MRTIKLFCALMMVGLSGLPGARVGSVAASYRGHTALPVSESGALLPTQVIVRTKSPGRLGALAQPDPRALEQSITQATGARAAFIHNFEDRAVYRFDRHLEGVELEDALNQIAAMDGIASVEPDVVVQAVDSPNDTYYSLQWDLRSTPQGINVEPAWTTTHGSASVPIAILDTGFTVHPDLTGQIVGGYDFISYPLMAGDGNGRDPNPKDTGDWTLPGQCGSDMYSHPASWHGTHVNGTVGALTNNLTGVAGIASGSPIEVVRVLGRCGGYLSDIADGLRWAAGLHVEGVPDNPRPAWVINMSLGGETSCPGYLQTAIDEVRTVGGIVVAAAGNNNNDVSTFTPANCTGVIAVGATNSQGSKSSYSNYGPRVTLSAPGDSIASTWNNGTYALGSPTYAWMSGTSMATPHVTAVAALILAVKPGLAPDQVTNILTSSTHAFPAGSTCTSHLCGEGILDAGQAVQAAMNANVDVPQVRPVARQAPTPVITSMTPLSGYRNADVTISLGGENLSFDTVIRIGGREFTGNVEDSQVITVFIPKASLTDGLYPVAVYNQDGTVISSSITEEYRVLSPPGSTTFLPLVNSSP